MKHLYFSPINFVIAGQRIQKIHLGHSCCGDNSRHTLLADGPANRLGSLFSSSFAQQFLVIEHPHHHLTPPCNTLHHCAAAVGLTRTTSAEGCSASCNMPLVADTKSRLVA